MHGIHQADANSISVTRGPAVEAALMLEISAIASSRAGVDKTLENITRLLERTYGCLTVEVFEARAQTDLAVARRRVPAASVGPVLSVPLREGGLAVGDLKMTFRPGVTQNAPSRVVATFVAEQISLLLARRRLAARRHALQARLDYMRQDLATLKVVARATGLLVNQHQLTESAARAWLHLESRATGLSPRAIAKQVIARHQSQPNPVSGASAGVRINMKRKTA